MRNIALITTALCIMACGNSGGGKSIPTSTTLKSTTLSSTSSAASAAKRASAKAISTSCGESTFKSCVTPSSVTGQVYYAGLMIGDKNGYSLGPIVGEIIDPSEATAFATTELSDFDLGATTTFSGTPTCCEGSAYPADASATLSRIEMYFGYVDATFTLASTDSVATALQATHTIRTVYADITGTAFKKGDLLYKNSTDTDFMWCTTDDGCTLTTRPTSPIQYSDVANFSSSGLGNQNIATFAATLADGHETLSFPEATVLASSYTITADFTMTNSVVFTSDLTTLTTVPSMVSAFRLAAEPGSSTGGFTVTVTATATAVAAD
jgi:hypothetical protein